ncbi:MAG: iron export ABC transporter permease subunit FetB [Deltaproteobacteria bacterium]|nr:iron export ABC transporter permease subunit FetB [Deltaproteobacteria bacterium]
MNTLPITAFDILLSSSLVAVAGGVSLALRLGLERRIAVAAARTVVQLLLVGLVLRWVFALDRWWVIAAILLSMVVNAGIAGVRRTGRRYRGIWLDALLAVSVSCVLVTFTVTEIVIGVDPWYEPRYLIPLMGMVLGNTLTGLSLCLDRITADLDTRRVEVEGWLALGATGWEATRPIVAEAARTGMVPILNVMTVAGIVTLPGMMTGQILAGEPPMQAVKYQIVVMFMIAAGAAIGSLIAALLAFRRLVTPAHQLAAHRLRRVS